LVLLVLDALAACSPDGTIPITGTATIHPLDFGLATSEPTPAPSKGATVNEEQVAGYPAVAITGAGILHGIEQNTPVFLEHRTELPGECVKNCRAMKQR
jgi:hypothetical protein